MRDPCPFKPLNKTRPTLHTNINVMKTMPVVLNNGPSVPKLVPSQYKKACFKNVQKLKKKSLA